MSENVDTFARSCGEIRILLWTHSSSSTRRSPFLAAFSSFKICPERGADCGIASCFSLAEKKFHAGRSDGSPAQIYEYNSESVRAFADGVSAMIHMVRVHLSGVLIALGGHRQRQERAIYSYRQSLDLGTRDFYQGIVTAADDTAPSGDLCVPSNVRRSLQGYEVYRLRRAHHVSKRTTNQSICRRQC